MKEKVSDILCRMAPYIEASGVALEVFFVDEDFGMVEVLVRPKTGAADEDIAAIQYSVEQMILHKAAGIRQVEFFREVPDTPTINNEEDVPDLADTEGCAFRQWPADRRGLALDDPPEGTAAPDPVREGLAVGAERRRPDLVKLRTFCFIDDDE